MSGCAQWWPARMQMPRASFSVYNSEQDVDALIAGLRAALELFAHA